MYTIWNVVLVSSRAWISWVSYKVTRKIKCQTKTCGILWFTILHKRKWLCLKERGLKGHDRTFLFNLFGYSLTWSFLGIDPIGVTTGSPVRLTWARAKQSKVTVRHVEGVRRMKLASGLNGSPQGPFWGTKQKRNQDRTSWHRHPQIIFYKRILIDNSNWRKYEAINLNCCSLSILIANKEVFQLALIPSTQRPFLVLPPVGSIESWVNWWISGPNKTMC